MVLIVEIIEDTEINQKVANNASIGLHLKSLIMSSTDILTLEIITIAEIPELQWKTHMETFSHQSLEIRYGAIQILMVHKKNVRPKKNLFCARMEVLF